MVVASVGDSLMIKTAQGVRIEGELPLKDIPESEHFDVIIIPGGKSVPLCGWDLLKCNCP